MKRYYICGEDEYHCFNVCEDKEGEWVRFSDVEHLLASSQGVIMGKETKYHYAREVVYQLRVCRAITQKVYLHRLDKINEDEKKTSVNN